MSECASVLRVLIRGCGKGVVRSLLLPASSSNGANLFRQAKKLDDAVETVERRRSSECVTYADPRSLDTPIK